MWDAWTVSVLLNGLRLWRWTFVCEISSKHSAKHCSRQYFTYFENLAWRNILWILLKSNFTTVEPKNIFCCFFFAVSFLYFRYVILVVTRLIWHSSAVDRHICTKKISASWIENLISTTVENYQFKNSFVIQVEKRYLSVHTN